jgi:hypothetical protein
VIASLSSSGLIGTGLAAVLVACGKSGARGTSLVAVTQQLGQLPYRNLTARQQGASLRLLPGGKAQFLTE